MQGLLESFFPRQMLKALHLNGPVMPLTIEETEEAYHLRASVPGGSELRVEIDDRTNVLKITATSEEVDEPPSTKKLVRNERVSLLSRSLQLPDDANGSDVYVSHARGVLHIKIAREGGNHTHVREFQIHEAGEHPEMEHKHEAQKPKLAAEKPKRAAVERKQAAQGPLKDIEQHAPQGPLKDIEQHAAADHKQAPQGQPKDIEQHAAADHKQAPQGQPKDPEQHAAQPSKHAAF